MQIPLINPLSPSEDAQTDPPRSASVSCWQNKRTLKSPFASPNRGRGHHRATALGLRSAARARAWLLHHVQRKKLLQGTDGERMLPMVAPKDMATPRTRQPRATAEPASPASPERERQKEFAAAQKPAMPSRRASAERHGEPCAAVFLSHAWAGRGAAPEAPRGRCRNRCQSAWAEEAAGAGLRPTKKTPPVPWVMSTSPAKHQQTGHAPEPEPGPRGRLRRLPRRRLL